MEGHSGSSHRSGITGELLIKLAEVLGLEDEQQRQHLAARAVRYAKAYHFALNRQKIVHSPGDTRVEAETTIAQIERLRKAIKYFETSDWIADEYKLARRKSGRGHRPSLRGLHAELAALQDVCTAIADSDPLSRGPKGNAILGHHIGAFVALFTRLTGKLPTIRSYRDGSKGSFLAGPAGKALLLAFEAVDPLVTEASLAAIVKDLLRQFPNGLTEGHFHLISGIEDSGFIEVRDTRG